jgi:triacylglycerol lipase
MPFTNTTAAACGLLAMHAMDMYRVNTASLTPTAAPGLTAAGWTVLGYITGDDALLRQGPLQRAGNAVCYGFLAGRPSGEMVAVIRGTDGFVLSAGLGTMLVEQGFWSLYQSMQLIDLAGAPRGALAPAIAAVAGATGTVTVIGHSLGSALATYLTLDLGRGALGGRTLACLFASPRTGNQGFVNLFDQTISDYRLFNYILDIVPRVPLGLGYVPLPRRTVLQPATAEANIRVNIECNHHVICYCAMLDYEGTMAATTPVPAGEGASAACILGPETGKPTLAKQLVSDLAGIVPV